MGCENYDLKLGALTLRNYDLEVEALTLQNYDLKVDALTLRELRAQSSAVGLRGLRAPETHTACRYRARSTPLPNFSLRRELECENTTRGEEVSPFEFKK